MQQTSTKLVDSADATAVMASSSAVGKAHAVSPQLYLPELDILRFLAFTMVFLFHTVNTTRVPSGAFARLIFSAEISLRYAVSLFFLLSAFLITLLLEAELDRNQCVHIKAFYIRRIVRIWPVYFLVLLICGILGRIYSSWHLSSALILYFLLMTGNWWLLSHPLDGPLIPMWSISVEEQFYLLVPLVVGYFKRAGLVVMSVIAIAGSFGTLLWMGWKGVFFELGMRVNSFVEVQFFAAGILLALAYRRVPWKASVLPRVLLLAFAVTAWTLSVYIFDISIGIARIHFYAPLGGYVFLLAGCIAILLSFLGLRVMPAMRPLLFLGKISYGLYAYHLIVIELIRRISPDLSPAHGPRMVKHALAFAITIVLAWLSYMYFETPFLRLKKRFTFIQSRAI